MAKVNSVFLECGTLSVDLYACTNFNGANVQIHVFTLFGLTRVCICTILDAKEGFDGNPSDHSRHRQRIAAVAQHGIEGDQQYRRPGRRHPRKDPAQSRRDGLQAVRLSAAVPARRPSGPRSGRRPRRCGPAGRQAGDRHADHLLFEQLPLFLPDAGPLPVRDPPPALRHDHLPHLPQRAGRPPYAGLLRPGAGRGHHLL